MPIGGGVGSQTALVATVDLSAAELLALGTPLTVIPSPEATQMIFPLGMAMYLHFGTIAYATNTTVRLDYSDGAGGTAGDWVVTLGTTLSATRDTIGFDGSSNAANADVPSKFLGRAAVIYTVGGNPTAGDGTATLSVPYVLLDFA